MLEAKIKKIEEKIRLSERSRKFVESQGRMDQAEHTGVINSKFKNMRDQFDDKIKGLLYEIHNPNVVSELQLKTEASFDHWLNMRMGHPDAAETYHMLKKLPYKASKEAKQTWKSESQENFKSLLKHWSYETPIFDADSKFAALWKDKNQNNESVMCSGMRQNTVKNGIVRLVKSGKEIHEGTFKDGQMQGLQIYYTERGVTYRLVKDG